jgi:hypothetical protein
MNERVPITSPRLPALVTAAGERAGMRFLEFFAANIRNPHTRRAYARAAEEFLAGTGVCPDVTMCRGLRADAAGLTGRTWPVWSQSNRWRRRGVA